MAVQLNVDGDVKRAMAKLNLSKGRVLKAAAQALNRTASQVRTQAIKEIARVERIKQADVRKYVQIRVRANRRSLRAEVTASGKAPNLIEWVDKDRRNTEFFRPEAGVLATTMGQERMYADTFIVKAKNGKLLVVKRSMSAKRVGKKWQPKWSKGIYGPPPKREFANQIISVKMKAVAKERWPINWKQALNFALSESGAG
jgi:hypothetical protein